MVKEKAAQSQKEFDYPFFKIGSDKIQIQSILSAKFIFSENR